MHEQQVSIGISVSDFSPDRGATDLRVWELADHLEYGGYAPMRSDVDLAAARSVRAMPVGRHLVRTELSEPMDFAGEPAKIAEDASPYRVAYFVTDAELWTCGYAKSASLWARPFQLSKDRAIRASANAQVLSTSLGVPVFVENPALIHSTSDFRIDDFLRAVADAGGEICLDIGHFFATVRNTGQSLDEAWNRLPFDAIGMAHIAGLSAVRYLNCTYLIDNHDIPPLPECLNLLTALLRRAPDLRWITYEAELASTDVQLSGLLLVKDAVQGAQHA